MSKRVNITLTEEEFAALQKARRETKWMNGESVDRRRMPSLSHVAATYVFRGLTKDKYLKTVTVGTEFDDVYDSTTGMER